MAFKLYIILSFIFCGIISPFIKEEDNTTTFEKTLNHPGLKKGEDQTLTFTVEKTTGKVSSKVASVMCYTNECKIITVTLEWDQFGNFLALNIPENQSLEKHLDGKTMSFSPKDYNKLDRILNDNVSILSDLTKDDIYVEDDEEVDGYSGATKAIVGKKDVVKGATLTCFTLWHWANHPEIQKTIRQRSLKEQTEESLQKILLKNHPSVPLFALQTITEKDYEIEQYWSYYRRVANDLTGREMRSLLKLSDAEQKLDLFQHLTNMSLRRIVIISTFREDHFTPQLLDYIKFDNYQEVNLLIDFLTEYKIESEIINQKLIPQLSNENLLISRGVYWYLSDCENLNKKQLKLMKKFERKHKKNL
ncbi:hypothetical protein [Flammeovirga sp. EKP202]|uniref:hypothetical protein n=1 Tax=Flammeovirga sp. EKP202 TaxID=2770592 RepID=UPI00165F5C1E|nr:hypothetical protein [Flammeovirga sp. EKP202]MBD0403515.1 hypothetical protein [Flammeovirga sp. EKP202]